MIGNPSEWIHPHQGSALVFFHLLKVNATATEVVQPTTMVLVVGDGGVTIACTMTAIPAASSQPHHFGIFIAQVDAISLCKRSANSFTIPVSAMENSNQLFELQLKKWLD